MLNAQVAFKKVSVSSYAKFDANGCRVTAHVSCRALKLWSFGGGSGGEKFFAVGEEAFLPGGGHGEDGAGSGRELVEGEGVGGGELLLPFRGAEDGPAFGGDPVDAGHVGGGDDAFDFEEFGVALGARGVGDDRACFVSLTRVIAVEVDEGEHLASKGFVPDPEDEIGSPLHGFDGVREGQKIGSKAFGVHAGPFRGYPLPPRGYFGHNLFIMMLIAAGCAAKILHSNELHAKYYKQRS
jgi:hypothetical protein